MKTQKQCRGCTILHVTSKEMRVSTWPSCPVHLETALSKKSTARLFPTLSLVLLVYLVTQGTALCWGWGLLGAATPNAPDGLWLLASAGHLTPLGISDLCPPGTAKCLAFEKIIAWVYKYSYKRKDNSLVSFE